LVIQNSEFRIKDNQLLSCFPDLRTEENHSYRFKIKEGSGTGHRSADYYYPLSYTICYTVGDEGNQGQVVGVEPGGSVDYPTVGEVCITTTLWVYVSTSGGGGGYEDDGTGGGGGGNTGGGSWPDDPCDGIGGSNNGARSTEVPCAEGPGWEPIEDEIEPDCDDYILALQNDTTFAAKFKSLNTSSVLNLNYEKGYVVKNRASNEYIEVEGNAGEPHIYLSHIGIQINGVIHSHFTGLNSIFSPGDMLFMAQFYIAGKARDSANLFWGVTSSYGDPYLVKVTNTAKYRAFAEKIVAMEQNPKKSKRFTSIYKNWFNSNSVTKNEKGFLDMLDDLKVGDGMTLYRANNTECTQWTKLTLSASGNVVTTNCF
jgi:hypothetical protein